jgi:hypothetical protein
LIWQQRDIVGSSSPGRRSIFSRRFFLSVSRRKAVPPKDVVDRILSAARRLFPADPAAPWIVAWALGDRGWPMRAIARSLGMDGGLVVLAMVRVRNTPELLAAASALLPSRTGETNLFPHIPDGLYESHGP